MLPVSKPKIMLDVPHIIKSKDFSINFIGQYKLTIKCLARHLKISVIDTTNEQWLYYESHKLDPPKKPIESMDIFWDKHPFLKAQYWKNVQIITNQPNVSFVPKVYDNEAYYSNFLKLNGNSTQNNIFSFKSKVLDIISIFDLDVAYETFFRVTTYPQTNLTFVHNSAIFLENVLVSLPRKNRHIYINVSENFMTIVIFENDKLFFIHHDQYHKPLDIVYFIRTLIDYFGFENSQTYTTLWGDLESNHGNFLQKQLPNFSFGSRPPALNIPSKFDVLTPHVDFDILG